MILSWSRLSFGSWFSLQIFLFFYFPFLDPIIDYIDAVEDFAFLFLFLFKVSESLAFGFSRNWAAINLRDNGLRCWREKKVGRNSRQKGESIQLQRWLQELRLMMTAITIEAACGFWIKSSISPWMKRLGGLGICTERRYSQLKCWEFESC